MAAASTGALSFPGFSSPKMEDHRLPRLHTGTAPASSSSSRVFSPLQGSELFHPGVAGGAGAVQDGPISSDSAPACEAHGHRDSGRAGPVPEPTWSSCSVEAHKPGVLCLPGESLRSYPAGLATGHVLVAWPAPGTVLNLPFLLHSPICCLSVRSQAMLGMVRRYHIRP